MILFLDNNVLPGIKPDLSDLVESYAKNIIRDDVYHNVIVDKYEMAKQWNVPFVELLPSQDKDRKIAVIIGTYSFESVKRGKELIWFNYHCATLYDFTKCPRIEGPIFLQGYSLKKVEASYKEMGE